MMPDPEKVAGLIREAAAAEIMPRFRALADVDIIEKGPGDLVTVADREAERHLTAAFRALLPGSMVVGEEAAHADAGVLDALAGEAPCWIIDPVDGTANFAAGKPLFAVMVALARAGEIVASWIYDPVADSLTVAEAGAGAYTDGVRLSVAAGGQPGALVGATSFKYFPAELKARARSRVGAFAATHQLRCAGHEYLRIADGRWHFSVYHRMLPWDHAPGHLIHREAGGEGAFIDGSRYRVTRHSGGFLSAPDRDTWQAIRRCLFAEAG